MSRNKTRSLVRAWAMYDWANSAYNLVITTTFFPVYFVEATKVAFGANVVEFCGYKIENDVLYDYSIACAYILVILLIPLCAVLADKYHKPLTFLRLFTIIGACSCSLLFFFTGENLILGIACFVLSTLGYAASAVFYNSFLPRIVRPYLQDSVSAYGFMCGYVGSVILQLLGILLLFLRPWGISEAMAVRLSFLSVGIWWLCFALYTFRALQTLPRIKYEAKNISWYATFAKLFRSIGIVILVARRNSRLATFLWGYFFYNMGLEAIMLVAIVFGKKDLNIATTHLIITAVILQLIALWGAQIMNYLRQKIGSVNTLLIMTICWTVICLSATLIQSELEYYILAFSVGLIMGATQSLSRSTYSKQIPYPQKSASFFMLYDLLRHLGLVLGLFGFGFIAQVSNTRFSILFLSLLFLIGLGFLFRLRRLNQNYKLSSRNR